jgi:hypothetical protein
MAVQSSITINVAATESAAPTVPGSGPAVLTHLIDYVKPLSSGTTANTADLVYSGVVSFTTSPTDLDLRGALTSRLDASAVSTVEIVAIVVRNTATSNNLVVGAGSNPVSSLWIAAGDGVNVLPGGIFILVAPGDPAYTTTAATADILRITASSGTVTGEVLILGRSA